MRAQTFLSGYTLLEVLVALLLLALALVGSTAMQLVALRVGYQDQLLAQAQYLASTLAERMRANAAQAGDASAANPYLFVYDAEVDAAPAAPSLACFTAACNALQLAQFDRYEVARELFERLPSGRLLVCRDHHPVMAGTLRWACDGGATAPMVIKLGWRGQLRDAAAATDTHAGGAQFVPALALTVRVP